MLTAALGPVPPVSRLLPTLGQSFLIGGNLSHREHFAMSGDVFGCHDLGWGWGADMVLASGG